MCQHAECGCEQHIRHTPVVGWHHQGGCCCGSGYAPRRFASREEVASRLEDYLGQLRAETKGVEERIAELRKEG